MCRCQPNGWVSEHVRLENLDAKTTQLPAWHVARGTTGPATVRQQPGTFFFFFWNRLTCACPERFPAASGNTGLAGLLRQESKHTDSMQHNLMASTLDRGNDNLRVVQGQDEVDFSKDLVLSHEIVVPITLNHWHIFSWRRCRLSTSHGLIPDQMISPWISRCKPETIN